MESYVLPINTISLVTDNKTANFSLPFYDGVMIMDSGLLTDHDVTPSYGDKVTLNFWRGLQIPIGDQNETLTILHLQEGYTYIYNRTNNTFKEFDNTNTLLLTRENITSIADLGIDFNIYKSHQFMIVLTYRDTLATFFRHAYLNYLTYITYIFNLESGINELYLNNDLYSLNIVPSIAQETYLVYNKLELSFLSFFINMDTGLSGDIVNPNSSSKYPFYYTDYALNYALAESISHNCYVQDYDYTIPLLTASLFPALLPCIAIGETVNNRPVYEPWLIWGFFKLLANHLTSPSSTNDDYEFLVFDLSPAWG